MLKVLIKHYVAQETGKISTASLSHTLSLSAFLMQIEIFTGVLPSDRLV